MSKPEMGDVNAVIAEASRQAGRERAAVLTGTEQAPILSDGGRPERESWRTTGMRLELREVDGFARYFLGEAQLNIGDALELYTNHANRWIRGRFEWSGDPNERPRFAINLWDPDGPRDADGLPPWVGDLEGSLPPRAICRFPTR